jgi:hypothetical protein
MPEAGERGGLGVGGWQAFPGVVVAPAATYAKLAQRPQWIGSFVLGLIMVAASAWVSLTPTLEVSYDSAESTMQRLGLPDEERERALAEMPAADDRSPRVLGQYVGGAMISLAIAAFLGAAVLHGIARFSGRPATFGTTLALFMPAWTISCLGSLVKAALMAASGTVEVTLGPGALVPDLPYHSLGSILLDLLDVFSIWNLVVLVLGAERLYGATRNGARGISGTYWGIKALFVAGIRLFGAWMLGAL